jgi:deaminated glutathione amidase
MRIGLVQLCVTDDPVANLPATVGFVRDAAAQGAQFVLTPECTNGLSSNRERQRAVVQTEDEDRTLATLRTEAKALGIWLLIGSLGIKTGDADGRFANRSFLIDPTGAVAARYDKIHMFDVNVSETEVYRESAAYRPGDKAVLAETPLGKVGMTVCYDLRFPHLFRALAQAGADGVQPHYGCGALGGAVARAGDRDRVFRAGPGADGVSCRGGGQGEAHAWPFTGGGPLG